MKTPRMSMCYLRTQRRTWGLTQKELAGLLGLKSREHLSRLENGKRSPTIRSAFACEVLFGLTPSAMFPNTYALSEGRLVRRVRRLHATLERTKSASSARKLELVIAALMRAHAKLPTQRRYD